MTGLALNYAAYESEIYRGALLAVPAGTARSRADARLQHRADAAADPRAAGISTGASADDQ